MNHKLPRHFLVESFVEKKRESFGLGLILGPFGLLYSTVLGGIIMTVLECSVLIGVRIGTSWWYIPLGIIVCHFICGIWGYFAEKGFNKKQMKRYFEIQK